MKNYKKAILPLLLLIIICTNYRINGSQQSDTLRWLFFSADRSANPAHLGIYYDPQYCMKKGNDLNLSDLFGFRARYTAEENNNIVDYALDSNNTFKITYPRQISEVGETKNLCKLLGNTAEKNVA